MEYVASSFGYSNILHTLYYIIDLWSVHVSVCVSVCQIKTTRYTMHAIHKNEMDGSVEKPPKSSV